MKYAIDSYLKAKAKWGRINEMQDEIDKIMRDRNNIENGINNLFGELLKGLSSKKIEIKGVVYTKDERRESTLLMSHVGFAYIPYGRRSHACSCNKELYETIAKNKETILKAIPRGHGDKKEIISIFIGVWEKYKYEFKPIRIDYPIHKMVTWVSHGYSGDKEDTNKVKAESCSIELRDSDSKIAFVFQRQSDKDLDDSSLNSNDFKENMIKEQLYLPLWKMLVKAKRRANKELAKAKKIDQELRKELTPFLVAKAI